MQKLFNVFACAAIVILLCVIFLPKPTVSAKVDSMEEINDALEGYAYDRLSYDGTNGVFKIHYQCMAQGLCSPREIHIPVDLEDVSVH